jgi:LysR family transcriptional regulator, nitrogen assimilation regulatory protein
MDIKHIRAFVAAYEEGSLSRAAARLGTAQPSLSVLIRDLEIELGLSLFDRSPRGVEPTAPAAMFYPRCQSILHEFGAAREALAGWPGAMFGKINVGLPPTIAKGVLPHVMARFTEKYPQVDIRVAEAFSGTLMEWTLAGEVECAIVAVPPVDDRLTTRWIASEPVALIKRADGTVNASTTPVRFDQLPPLKLVLPSPRHSLRQMIDAEIFAGRIPISRTVEIDGLYGMLEFVRITEWVTILSASAILNEVDDERFTVRPLADQMPQLAFYVIHLARKALPTATAVFIKMIEEGLETSLARWRAATEMDEAQVRPPPFR